MYELNASCPNTSHGGMVFGTDPDSLYHLANRCRHASRRPLMVKLSPNVTSIALMARVCADAGVITGKPFTITVVVCEIALLPKLSCAVTVSGSEPGVAFRRALGF